MELAITLEKSKPFFDEEHGLIEAGLTDIEQDEIYSHEEVMALLETRIEAAKALRKNA